MALHAEPTSASATTSAVVVEDLSRTQIVQYAGASGDYNPLHTDEVFATQVAGYPSVFAHGMLTMGMTGRMLTDLVGDGRLTQLRRPVHVAGVARRHLTATATVEAIRGEDGGDRRRPRGQHHQPGRRRGVLRPRLRPDRGLT